MHHRKDRRKLARTSAHRTALFRNLVSALIEHERITTTEAKAKELRRLAERLVTSAKRAKAAPGEGNAKRVHAIRNTRAWVADRDLLSKLFGDLADRFEDRPGGYTRIYKLGNRPGDQAPMALIEFVEGKAKAAVVGETDETAQQATGS